MGRLGEWLATPIPWAGDLATLLGALIVGFLVYGTLAGLRWLLRRRLKATVGRGPVDDLIFDGITRIHRPILLSISLTVGLRLLPLPDPLPGLLHQAQWLILSAQFAVWSDLLATFGALAISHTLSSGKYHVPGLQLGIKLILWVLVGITTLDNLGVDLSSLLTGLGIGGIAVALAAQRVIGDLISTVTIAMDRPFVEGDFISVGDVSGQVLRIGLKTTRLRSLSGEELIIPNADLVTLRVRNLSHLENRKVVLHFPICWETPAEKLSGLPLQIEALFEGIPDLKFGYAVLVDAENNGFRLEVQYSLLIPEKHLALQHLFLLKMAEMLEKESISLGVKIPSLVP